MKDGKLRKYLGVEQNGESQWWSGGQLEILHKCLGSLISSHNALDLKINMLLDNLGLEYQTSCREVLPKIVKKEKKHA